LYFDIAEDHLWLLYKRRGALTTLCVPILGVTLNCWTLGLLRREVFSTVRRTMNSSLLPIVLSVIQPLLG